MDKEPLWTKDFGLLAGLNFFNFFSFYLLLPTLSVYAAKLGGSEGTVGLIFGIFTIAAVAIRPWTGQYLDQNPRRPIYTLALVVFLLSAAGYSLVTNIMMLFFLRVIHGLSWGVITTSGGTLAADIIPPSRRGEGMGYYGMAVNVAMTVGPAFGLWMMNRWGFNELFISSALIACVSVLLLQMMRVPDPQGAKGPQTSGWTRFFEPRVLPLSGVFFLTTLIYGGIVSFIPLYADQRGLGNGALFFTIFALANLLSRPVAGKMYDQLGPRSTIFPGQVLMITAVLLLGISPSMITYVSAAVTLGLGFGAVGPGLQALIIQIVEPRRRGAATATLMSAMDLGIGVGSVALGVVAGWLGYGAMYLVSAIPGILAAIWFFRYYGESKEEFAQARQKN